MRSQVSVEGVSKHFRRRSTWRHREHREAFWALRDVNLELSSGEAVGLVGRNGSGKSTLLKCVARTVRPTSGRITTRGRMVSLLELGAGFHPDLTGRENVLLNAAVLGVDKAHVDSVFDDIVDYAELGEFIDEPVRHFSSGMQARLGFSIAIHVDADIILVDEVLAVGDEMFQRRCIDSMLQFRSEGRTLVVVAHQIPAIRAVCTRVAVMEHGSVTFDGPTEEGIDALRRSLAQQRDGSIGRSPDYDPGDPPSVRVLAHDDLLELRVHYEDARQPLPTRARVIVVDESGMPALTSDESRAAPVGLHPLNSLAANRETATGEAGRSDTPDELEGPT